MDDIDNMKWEQTEAPITKKQRIALYKFGLGNLKPLVKGMTFLEAQTVIGILVAIKERIKDGSYDTN